MEQQYLNMVDKSKFFERIDKNLFDVEAFSDIDMFDNDENVNYQWTRDKSDIENYTKLIDDSYAEEINFTDSYKRIDVNDINSKFFIGKHQGRVVGGIRLSIHDMILDNLLPTETQGISYKEMFEDFDLEHNNYCELTRYGVDKNYRNSKKHYIECLGQCKEIMADKNIRYLFIPSGQSRLKLYNVIAKKFFKVLGMCKVEVPDHSKYRKIKEIDDFHIGMYEVKENENSGDGS